MSSRVSIVTPCYRQAHFLGDALDSACAQDYPEVDIVVVNDGSPDAADIERIVTTASGAVRYISHENRGVSSARNTGLAACTGDYVIFLDADDRLLPGAVRVGVEAFRDRPGCALVWGLRRLIDERGRMLQSVAGEPIDQPTYADLLATNIVGPPVGVMFRRAALVDIGGFATVLKCAEDYDVYCQLAHRHQIHFHGAVVADYRLHDDNMSANGPAMLRGVLRALDRQWPTARRDARLRDAWRAGCRDARVRYGWGPGLAAAQRQWRNRRWLAAAFRAARLAVNYPTRSLNYAASSLARRTRRPVTDLG